MQFLKLGPELPHFTLVIISHLPCNRVFKVGSSQKYSNTIAKKWDLKLFHISKFSKPFPQSFLFLFWVKQIICLHLIYIAFMAKKRHASNPTMTTLGNFPAISNRKLCTHNFAPQFEQFIQYLY